MEPPRDENAQDTVDIQSVVKRLVLGHSSFTSPLSYQLDLRLPRHIQIWR